jgi:hypothetical protein
MDNPASEVKLKAATEDASKNSGFLHTISEKAHDAGHFIAETIHAGVEKVEHLGTAIKETVMPPPTSVEEKASREIKAEAEKTLHMAKQGTQSVAGGVEQAAKDVKKRI